jgi:hypothetical protein
MAAGWTVLRFRTEVVPIVGPGVTPTPLLHTNRSATWLPGPGPSAGGVKLGFVLEGTDNVVEIVCSRVFVVPSRHSEANEDHVISWPGRSKAGPRDARVSATEAGVAAGRVRP